MPRIFISYSRFNRPFVNELVPLLRKIYGHDSIWFDDELYGGQRWWDAILDQIEASGIFIYLLSEQSVISAFCQAEYTEARRLQKDILPILIDGQATIPNDLTEIQYVDLSKGLNDAIAQSELHAAIVKNSETLRVSRRPLWHGRTPLPGRSRKIRRSFSSLVQSLQSQTDLLQDYYFRAFQDRVPRYYGEVAAKLRLLVYEDAVHVPLLLALMDEFGLDFLIALDGPPIEPLPGEFGAGDKITLRRFLDLPAAGVTTPTQELAVLSKRELIGRWGVAAQEWDHEESFYISQNRGNSISIFGIPAPAMELRIMAEEVLNIAYKFLNMLSPGHIVIKDAERILRIDPTDVIAQAIELAQQGRYEKALEKIHEQTPKGETTTGKYSAHIDLGLALLYLGRFEQAADTFQQAILLDGTYVHAHYNLACAYSQLGNFSKCLEIFERAKGLQGFADFDPISDPDFAGIRNDQDWGARFISLVKKEKGEDQPKT